MVEDFHLKDNLLPSNEASWDIHGTGQVPQLGMTRLHDMKTTHYHYKNKKNTNVCVLTLCCGAARDCEKPQPRSSDITRASTLQELMESGTVKDGLTQFVPLEREGEHRSHVKY